MTNTTRRIIAIWITPAILLLYCLITFLHWHKGRHQRRLEKEIRMELPFELYLDNGNWFRVKGFVHTDSGWTASNNTGVTIHFDTLYLMPNGTYYGK